MERKIIYTLFAASVLFMGALVRESKISRRTIQEAEYSSLNRKKIDATVASNIDEVLNECKQYFDQVSNKYWSLSFESNINLSRVTFYSGLSNQCELLKKEAMERGLQVNDLKNQMKSIEDMLEKMLYTNENESLQYKQNDEPQIETNNIPQDIAA